MSGILYDHRGQIIPNGGERKEAEEKLKEYMAKNQSMFQDWFNAHGITRPPIFYDTHRKEWYWKD